MKKRILALVLAMLLVVANIAGALAYDLETARASVVRIVVTYQIQSEYESKINPLERGLWTSTGSGFAVGEVDQPVQYFVTAAHVISIHNGQYEAQFTNTSGNQEYFPVDVLSIKVVDNTISNAYDATVAGCSNVADVAVVRIPSPITTRKAAVIRNSDPKTNEAVSAMGFMSASDVTYNELADSSLISTTDAVTVNLGAASRVQDSSTTSQGKLIQTNAGMSFGISGGPLVDNDGYVLGVNVGGAASTESANYAAAYDEILAVLRGIVGAKWVVGPLQSGPSLVMIIAIAAAALIIIGIIVAIIVSGNSKKNARSLTFEGPLAGKVVPLKKGVPVVIGRDPNKCQVIYAKGTPGISGVHCTITFDGNAVMVADNGSSYGTFLGSVKVEPGKPTVMHRGQILKLGADGNTVVLH